MRLLIVVILGLAVAPSAFAQASRNERGTPVIPINRLVSSESVVVTSGPAVGALQVDDFRLVASVDHFDITTSAPELDGEAERIARQAEVAYQAMAASFRHELSLRPLLVLYATNGDLQRSVRERTVPGNREHVLVPLDTPVAQLEGMLTHELSHVFLFEILSTQVPSWFTEGLAEAHRGVWDASDIAMLRSMVLAGTVPRLNRLDAAGQLADARQNHIIGHAIFDFLVARAGGDAVGQLLVSLRQNPAVMPLDAFMAAVGLAPDAFDVAFDAFLRDRFSIP